MNWCEKATQLIEELLLFAEDKQLIETVDHPYYRNLLLDVMDMDAPEGEPVLPDAIPATATKLLIAMCDLAVEKGLIEDIGFARDLFSARVMGLLTLPMLLARSPFLWHSALLLGLPGGLAALIFPAMLTTSAPFVTALGFHWLHATLVVAPLMPFALGRRPSRACVWHAWTLLMALGCLCLVANHLTGGNYLFLSVPVAGTPLEALAQGGLRAYRLSLMALAGVLLIAQGFVCRRIWRYS